MWHVAQQDHTNWDGLFRAQSFTIPSHASNATGRALTGQDSLKTSTVSPADPVLRFTSCVTIFPLPSKTFWQGASDFDARIRTVVNPRVGHKLISRKQ